MTPSENTDNSIISLKRDLTLIYKVEMEKAGAIWLIVYVITMNVCMGESMDIKTVYWNEVRGEWYFAWLPKCLGFGGWLLQNDARP